MTVRTLMVKKQPKYFFKNDFLVNDVDPLLMHVISHISIELSGKKTTKTNISMF